MAGAEGVETIRSDHCVEVNAFYWHLCVLQDEHIVFYILADFLYAFIRQYRCEFSTDLGYVQVLLAEGCFYGNWLKNLSNFCFVSMSL
ncbi:hypothetical protein ES703_92942 [subsurface metagenome]